MKLRTAEWLMLGLALLAFVAAALMYPFLPERLASHWNASGEVDGYTAKGWGLFLLPAVLALMALIFILIPRIDPLKANIEKFRGYYEGFVLLLMLVMLAVFAMVLLWNQGVRISPNVLMPLILSPLFFCLGVLCEKSRPNWFIGIRTPWTLSNERVWEKTHRVGGKLFKIAGVLGLAGVFFQKWSFLFVLVPVVAVALYTVVYSYVAYQQEIKKAAA